MNVKLSTPILFLFLWASRVVAGCNRTCGGRSLPFPFGFSDGCHIQLNCSTNGTALAAEFPVLNVTSNSILVSLPAVCNRPVEALGRLFTRTYAPAVSNAVLLQNCSGSLDSCLIPSRLLIDRFELLDCGHTNDSIQCYSETDNTSLFMDYGNLRQSGCRSLLSAVSVESMNMSNPSTPLDIMTVRLGWWLLGSCGCSDHANCDVVSPPLEGDPPAYWCRCFDGFVGDGFKDGVGCWNGTKKELHFNVHKFAIIAGSSVCALALLIPIIIYYFRNCIFLRKNSSNSNVEQFLLKHASLSQKRYSYYEIKKMTKFFKDKVGQGGYGIVYKGELLDGQLVAVKVLTDSPEDDAQEFINEVASISETSHVNIVRILGFCFEGKKKALVYEFMSNKSLDKFIYSCPECSLLGLDKLYVIALGVARGLEYMHTGCNTRIVHFDIKPQNILLDEDFCPKIADFGLAKLFKKKQSKISLLGTRGTIGYIAPEVFSRNFGLVSHKSDVYSYGMMLLEMVGAKEMVKTEPIIQSSENYFHESVYELVLAKKEKIDDMMRDEKEESKMKMLMVGVWCIQTASSDRPSISKVVEMLQGSVQSIEMPPKPSFPSAPLLESLQFSSSMHMETRSDSQFVIKRVEQRMFEFYKY